MKVILQLWLRLLVLGLAILFVGVTFPAWVVLVPGEKIREMLDGLS